MAQVLLACPHAAWQPASCPGQQSGMHVHVHVLTMSSIVCKTVLLQVGGRGHEIAAGTKAAGISISISVFCNSMSPQIADTTIAATACFIQYHFACQRQHRTCTFFFFLPFFFSPSGCDLDCASVAKSSCAFLSAACCSMRTTGSGCLSTGKATLSRQLM